MFLSKIHTFTYRNLEELHLDASLGIHGIIGKNGVGKTNILDSIYYLAFCKSNIATSDTQNVMHGYDSFSIQGLFEHDSTSYKIHCGYRASTKEKTIVCNDTKYTKFSDHIGLIPLVFVSPADMILINGGGSERRKFIDAYISLYNKEYLQNLLTYNKLLAQRNALLKQGRVDATYISIIDEQLADASTAIFTIRNQEIQELSELVSALYSKIATSEECMLAYQSQLHDTSALQGLQRNLEKDSILSFTSFGIHRDDIDFMFNDIGIKHAGSQGQKKSFLLALKFAQYQIIQRKTGVLPILLLDDLFDKLDKERTSKVFDVIEGEEFGQIFITDTDKMLLHTFFEARKQTGNFHMFEDGVLQRL